MELEGEVKLPKPAEQKEDLGFGSRVAEQSRVRLLNHDGTFNVERKGLPFFRSLSLYHFLLTVSWRSFYALVALSYLLTNLIFAIGYLLCGPGALDGAVAQDAAGRFWEAYFFSVQTLATIGYGKVSPNNLASHLLVLVEALVGLLGFALATGLLFARFSRPTADLLFSSRAIIAPYRGGKAFQFRLANSRNNQLTEVDATVVVTKGRMGSKGRQFLELKLERDRVMFLPLHWVVVHAIDESSPLWGLDEAGFAAEDLEFLILIKGVDETFSQSVHVRASYKHSEVLWNVRFRDMFLPSEDGVVRIDVRRLDEVDPV